MEHLEKVEKLKQRANVSYEEAKAALEECDWDMLEAIVLLEHQGKVKADSGSEEYVSGKRNQSQQAQPLTVIQPENGSSEAGKQQSHFFAKLGKAIRYLVQKGCENSLVVKQHGQALMDLPVIAFLILLICFFWVVIPIMAVSLFFDFSYNFKGAELGKDKINRTMEQATEAVNNFKSEINKEDKQ